MRTVDPGTGTDADPDFDESPAESESKPPPPARRLLVVCAVAGFLLGGGVLGLLWGLSGVHAGALEDAVAACQALDRVGELPDTSRDAQPALTPGLSSERLHRMVAARELAAAAAQVNANYQPLADQIDGVSRMVLSLHFNDISGQRHLTEAKEICGRI
ncbi:hypothetical protein AMES_0180 [Amycolatopsis mediterranei S699]|uniref:Uncharacterized protein n=2 Tax=Amycolatopsis mediterranei TaxID=33910 RepID=A0A0H3CTP1_AMYMU|nr:hypothetical protein [Amycolatopsis mediterranei]ADJ42007.1 hypothetical protein AMED_0184 [Amycolatopsis mediterranei U32]AEK38682.1 hypothetical protein RAM_00935 [Amycolatopsis mediterranei S699]AFO73717.1 hypothetical protein AMES_0180 [Amycolatopsis mediterranei S699]AGT80846.1 hypothetical protein B737_0181 [Amycolatopsis mediterranei RB]KDO08839.1 hypothetical protein DV26_20755 [Amycolatopsis mediterranei]